MIISEQQVCEFKKQGVLHLPNAIPESLLQQWQKQARTLEQDVEQAHSSGHQIAGVLIEQGQHRSHLSRYCDIYARDPHLCLDLLACPALIAIARQLCGRGVIPLAMDLLYKQPYPCSQILWHQDAPHSRQSPYLNVGIYLDDAQSGDGCLRCVPGSQHNTHDIEALSEAHGWDIPGTIEVPAKAGDIIIHDAMILHGSPPMFSDKTRRTLYVELRPFSAASDGGPHSENWVALRKQWMAEILSHSEKTYSEQALWPEDWKTDYPPAQGQPEPLMQKIVQQWEAAIPALWAINRVETDIYPVPAERASDQSLLT